MKRIIIDVFKGPCNITPYKKNFLMVLLIWVCFFGSEVLADIEDSIQEPLPSIEPVSHELKNQNSIQEPVSNVSDWNPYEVLPAWKPLINRPSILKEHQSQIHRSTLNTTYSGSVGLAAFAVGKELNITNGPFSITFTVHPNISSPRDVWVKITIFDPWQQVIAEGGYNRGYPSQETQTMKIFREGRYYMSIEGEFATLDYTIKTADIVPIIISMETPVPNVMEIDEEGMT